MKNESPFLLCGSGSSSQLIRVQEIPYTRQVMIHNSASAWHLHGEEGRLWSHSKRSESTQESLVFTAVDVLVAAWNFGFISMEDLIHYLECRRKPTDAPQ